MEFISKKQEVLGSQIEIFLPKTTKNNAKLFRLCFDELIRIQNKFSRFKDTSTLNKLNKNLELWQKVDAEFLYLIKKSLEIQKKTNGYFDITLKSTLENLGYDKEYSFQKKEISNFTKIKSKIKFLLFLPIKINDKTSQIYLRKEIELGGIGKGYALDRVYAILETNKVENFLINAGGDIRCKSNGEKEWITLLQHPDNLNKVIGEININNLAIAGSAPSYRKWNSNHHLINPKTNLPQKSVKTIFVLANTGIEADTYATALFASGFKNAIIISKKLNLEILVISSENKIYKSNNFNVKLYN